MNFLTPGKLPLSACLALMAPLLLLLSPHAVAADVSVSAELSRPQISAGNMAELQVKVTGAQQADVPQQIAVEGLQIRLTGQSTQVQMVNFKVSSSAVYSYVVMPLRTGNFTIPSVSVTADGRQFRTAPLAFCVQDAGAAGTAPAQPQQQSQTQPQQMIPGFPPRQARAQRAETGRLAFGEITCAKKSLYAGEMTPVEIRYYFDARYPVQVLGKVDFGSEGVLVERFPDPKESREDRDGVTYNVLTFHSLLSAVKPGSIDIAPAKLDCQIQMPGALPPGFDDPVFQQLMGGHSPLSETRELSVKTVPLHLDILPLPKEGRPASFGGAVGQFDIDAIVSNPRPSPGDPVNLVVKIGGKGNFNGMGTPLLTDTTGWRSYPPTDKFESTDELSYAGVKSFDYTLIAQQPQTLSPGAEFSYFDPVTAKYVTVLTKPLPLTASPGSSSPVPAAAGASPATPGSIPSSTTPASPVTVKEGDPLPVNGLRPWTTPTQRPEFLVASLSMVVAACALAAILWLRDLQAKGGTASSRRRKRITELWTLLNAGTQDAAASYDAAVEYASLVTVSTGLGDSVVTQLTERRDVVKYGAGGSLPLGNSEREELLETLRQLTPGKS
jgi:hypothetical protein